MHITIRQLEVFCAVARRNHVSRAAEEVLLSQSAASMALAELERQLGEPLFDRFGKKLVLNDNGKKLFPMAVDLLARADEIEGLFAGDGSTGSAQLTIGASSTIGNYLMPELLGRFSQAHPDVRVVLQVGNTQQVIESLVNCEIDLGYIEGVCRVRNVESRICREDELVVFAAPDHPLALKAILSLNDLAEACWVLRERGSGTREIFERALEGKLENLNVRYELGHTEAVKRAVEHGLGISCLSRLTVYEEIARGTLVELPVPFLSIRRNLYQLQRKGKYMTHALRRFCRFVEESAGER